MATGRPDMRGLTEYLRINCGSAAVPTIVAPAAVVAVPAAPVPAAAPNAVAGASGANDPVRRDPGRVRTTRFDLP